MLNSSNVTNIQNSLADPTTIIAKADSGASNHYWMIKDQSILNNLFQQLGPTVFLPNNQSITSTAHGHLPLPTLSKNSTKAHVLPGLQNSSLLSLGQLCDDGCIVHLTKSTLHVFKNNDLILTGLRNPHDGLWDVPLPQHPPSVLHSHRSSPSSTLSNPSCNVIIRKQTTKGDLAQYLHACAFSPAISTFLTAIKKGHFITWPGLTPALIKKHLPPSVFSAKGHLNQEMKNLQSTKKSYKDVLISSSNTDTPSCPSDIHHEDFHPTPEPSSPKTFNCFATIIDLNNTSTGFIDLTGRFPYRSSRGHQYLLLIYDYDSNAILVEPLKNRKSESIIQAWQKITKILERQGIQPKYFIMDNEASSDLKSSLNAQKYNLQLVPPENHRKNAAERGIQTFKNHFLAGLASLPPDFPLSEWDRLLEQGQLTLLLLRSSRSNPKLSSYAYLFGNFDFNRTPLAPPGTKTVVHNRPSSRPSWGFHGEDGFYIGPALDHYRCVKCFIPKTRSIRISDTVAFFPTTVPLPATSLDDHLRAAASDIVTLLSTPPPSTFPSLTITDSTREAIHQIAKLLNRATPLPSSVHSPKRSKQVSWKKPLCQIMIIPKIGTKHVKSKTTKTLFSSPPVPEPRVPFPLKTKQSPSSVSVPLRRSDRIRNQNSNNCSSHFPKSPPSLQRYKQPSYKALAATYLLAQQLFNPQQPHSGFLYNDNGKKSSIDDLLTGKDHIVWDNALSNEIGRLAQGNSSGVVGTNTIEFVPYSQVPSTAKVTYANYVCTHRPKKPEPWRIRIVVGGDKLHCPYDTGSPAAGLLETKLLLNSVISDAVNGARFFSIDLKDFFLASPMLEKEYMRMHIRHIPADIRNKYNINNIVHNNYVYIRINKGMYGLKQAAVLAYNNLVNVMQQYGYSPCPMSPGIWTHNTRRTKFCLCVDDFGIKYFNQDDAEHLIQSLKNHYNLTIDWKGEDYCGLHIDWNYRRRHVDISMPNYIDKVLLHHQTKPHKPMSTPHTYNTPAYGSKTQFAPLPDSTTLIPPPRQRRIQAVVGSLLYYARAIDGTLLPALNEISAKQANPTIATEKKVDHLLSFVQHHHKNVKLRFHASDMCLHIDSDAAYLVMPGARSRLAGYHYLSNYPSNPPTTTPIPLNGAVLIECRTIRHVVASAAEAETAGLFYNAQSGLILRQILEDLGHPQPPTPLKTDNTTANSFVHANMKMRRSKTWDKNLHWLRDREAQQHFNIYWDKGKNNHGDYFTKHHPPNYHRSMRAQYLQICSFISSQNKFFSQLQQDISQIHTHVQGCVGIPPYGGSRGHVQDLTHTPQLPFTSGNNDIRSPFSSALSSSLI